MRTFTTISDKNYLDKGIALYESINKFLSKYKLFYLCLDKFTFNKIKEINDPNLIPLYIDDEFRNNAAFKILENNNKSTPLDYSDFHFALGSFFTHHIMEKELPNEVLYVDSDIIFYLNPELIFNAVEKKSIGIILHRHNKVGCHVGGYNVGVVYFRNDKTGKECLTWWRNVVMDKSNKWAKVYGVCGDQKYLELFESMFGNVKILDEDVGHAAPWNFRLYKYFGNKTIIEWNGKLQPLVFIHFSHFSYTDTSYKVARKKEWKLFPPSKRYYDEYWKTLKDIKRRYKL